MALLFVCLFLVQTMNVYANGQRKSSREGNAPWSNAETGYCVIVEDDADLLSDDEETLLASQMQAITSYGNAVFKSISYNNYSASWFAEDYYHSLLGTGSSGTLFLIDMDNRELYIFSDGAVYRQSPPHTPTPSLTMCTDMLPTAITICALPLPLSRFILYYPDGGLHSP